MPTTELVVLSVTAGNEKIGDPSNKGALVLHETTQRLLSANGCQRVHFGNAIEDANTVRLLIDWDNLATHEEFMASSSYQTFLAGIKTIVSSKPIKHHVDFKPQGALASALAAPVTELVTFYFDEPQVPAEYGEGVEQMVKLFETADGYRACAWGSTLETDVEHNGIRGQAAVLAIGWDSVDAHMAFRETQTFKDNVSLLRSSSKAASMQHIQALQAQRD